MTPAMKEKLAVLAVRLDMQHHDIADKVIEEYLLKVDDNIERKLVTPLVAERGEGENPSWGAGVKCDLWDDFIALAQLKNLAPMEMLRRAFEIWINGFRKTRERTVEKKVEPEFVSDEQLDLGEPDEITNLFVPKGSPLVDVFRECPRCGEPAERPAYRYCPRCGEKLPGVFSISTGATG